jgi:hypothetical protein
MDMEKLRDALLFCTIINFALLWLWALLYLLPHAWWYGAARRMFHLSAEQLDAISLTGMVFYKLGIVLFNLVPYLALRLVK